MPIAVRSADDSSSTTMTSICPKRPDRSCFLLCQILVVELALGLAGCSGPRPTSTVAPGSNDLAFDVYGKLRDRETNFVFSPFSLTTALAMLHAGARGQTANEIARAAHLKDAGLAVSAAFGEISAD